MAVTASILYGPSGEQYSTYAVPTANYPAQTGTKGHRWPIGTQLVLPNNQKYRFAVAGASTLVVGNALNAIVPLSTDATMAPAAGNVGDTLITFTHGAATTVANIFVEGFAAITVAPGSGQLYTIHDHLALQNATAGDIINLQKFDALRVAITTSSKLQLIRNPYDAVIQAPATTVASNPAGVAVSAATAGQGCWVQTKGVASVLTSGTAIAGDVVGTGLGTAGAVGPIAALATQPIWGAVLVVAATGAWSTIFLGLDG